MFSFVIDSHKRPFALISGVYLLLALSYGLVFPIFELPDENIHYFTVQWIADNRALPYVPETAVEAEALGLEREWTGQEAAQPPLYYLLASVLVAPLDTADGRALTEKNPFVLLGDASSPQNRNAFVHGPAESFPWRGHVLAVHLLRIVSAVIGWGTLCLIYATAVWLWPNRPNRALWGMGVIAFLPQFVAQHAAVSNDVLIIFLVTAVLYGLLRVEGRDHEIESHQRPPWTADLWLGVGIGLAALTKNQGIVLAVFVLGTVVIRHAGRLPVRQILTRCLTIGGTIVVFAGWLWWRNWMLYGDITAANQFVLIAGGDRGYTVGQALAEWPSVWLSSIAVFGWFNIVPSIWIHRLWTAVCGVAFFVAVTHLARRVDITLNFRSLWNLFRSWPILLFGWGLAVSLSLITFMMSTPAAQGRLLFPALLPVALLLSVGFSLIADWLMARFPASPLQIMRSGLFAGLLGLHIYLLLFVISPVYARPSTLTLDQLPPEATRFDVDLGQGVTLVAAQSHSDTVTLGEGVPIDLYWRKTAETPDGERPEIVLLLFGRYTTLAGKLQTYHGGGLYPADLWPVEDGVILHERLVVPTFEPSEEVLTAVPAEVSIRLQLAEQPVELDIGVAKVVPAEWLATGADSVAQVGDQALLRSVALSEQTVMPGDSITVDVVWEITADFERDYVTFVHLGNPNEPPLAQGDGVPGAGRYPTRLWRAGERFADRYVVPIPGDMAPGHYRLIFGLFDGNDPTFARLPVRVDGVDQPESGLNLGEIEVVAR